MCAIGSHLEHATNSWSSASGTVQLALLFTAAWVLLAICFARPRAPESGAASLPQHPFFNIWQFYRRRFDFINSGFRVTGKPVFQFSLLQHRVVALSGESGRTAFFNSKSLDLHEGFKVLLGAIPIVPGVTSDLHSQRISLIHKRLASLQRNESLTQLIPAILEDCRRIMSSWESSGTMDPFDKIYDVVFQTTIRSLSSADIADDASLVARLKKLYGRLDSGTTPASVLMPWLPSPAMIKKLWATKEVYQIVTRAIKTRLESGISRNDTLQMLLDAGDDHMAIVGFIMGLLIAGSRSTGTTASWLITFIGGHPDWRTKVIAELNDILPSSPPLGPPRNLSTRLATIPLETWESSTPVLDSLIRETLRVAQPHTAMRKNTGPDMYVDNTVVPTGAFVVYPFSDVHLNPAMYPAPRKFDPSRKTDEKSAFGYLGWGAGNHICQGQRLARLSLKLIASMFLLGFDYEVVDQTGKPPNPFPLPDWNDILTCRPMAGSCYLKYERTDNPL
ncbi:hypothetical protein PLICRDRAFT_57687 [Plicaturopsis crispa FD-325 SS-3]|uniref:Cytochrome P450 n=1 Tax=Plicaturopsis crispa FD-325 SS-3 TaxID=944288 RepID=A0A0C9SXD2_PLICR|nr:hypothetical protein PLICRDRAFT_57687 [Plicaturopsis crispa FD-325 SS-3]